MIAKLILVLAILLQRSKYVFLEESERAAIVQGTPAKLGQFPYVVQVVTRPLDSTRKPRGFRCTGAILTELWVVTAAHCYSSFADFNLTLAEVYTIVQAGTIDAKEITTSKQIRRSEHHVMMEKDPQMIGPNAYNNDVLILKVNEPFDFNANVGPVTVAKRPLPEGNKLTCTVVGFGNTEALAEENKGPYNTKLYYTYGTLDGNKLSCRNRAKIRGDKVTEFWGEQHICMDPVDYSSSPCNGDSGGPIVCNGLDVGTSIGRKNINNADDHCGAKGNYHMYTFLGLFEDWLRKQIPNLPQFKRMETPKGSKALTGTLERDNASIRVASIGLVVFIQIILLDLYSSEF